MDFILYKQSLNLPLAITLILLQCTHLYTTIPPMLSCFYQTMTLLYIGSVRSLKSYSFNTIVDNKKSKED